MMRLDNKCLSAIFRLFAVDKVLRAVRRDEK